MAATIRPSKPEREFRASAAALAWLWPGLGHISLGERKRGGLIMFGILFLYVCGLLIGGFDSVDRQNDRLWYFAQVLCGPIVIAADAANQALIQNGIRQDWGYRSSRSDSDQDERIRRYQADDPEMMAMLRGVGISHVNEMGTLFIALAGLMNFVVILDSMFYLPRQVPERRRRGEEAK